MTTVVIRSGRGTIPVNLNIPIALLYIPGPMPARPFHSPTICSFTHILISPATATLNPAKPKVGWGG